MTNILRHASASEVWVSVLYRGKNLFLRVRDNGLGIDRNHARKLQSIGLKGMRERAAIVRGTLHVRPLLPHGTLVAARVPFRQDHEDADRKKRGR